MKKKLFIVVCALLGVLAASAQQKLVIKLENGERLTYETWQVDSLYFTAGDTIATPVKTDYVDLGFAKWSVYNFGLFLFLFIEFFSEISIFSIFSISPIRIIFIHRRF